MVHCNKMKDQILSGIWSFFFFLDDLLDLIRGIILKKVAVQGQGKDCASVAAHSERPKQFEDNRQGSFQLHQWRWILLRALSNLLRFVLPCALIP